jgi:hypothetical protein
MMAAPTAPTTPDLLSALDLGRPAAFGARTFPELDAPALEALVDAVDDRLEVAPADVTLDLRRARRVLELDLARALEE